VTHPGHPKRLARPYLIVRGRTRPTGVALAVEALVICTPEGERSLPAVRFEHRELLLLTSEPVSIAELAARLSVPLGVARILVGDLADERLVDVIQLPVSDGPDVVLLERVLYGLRAI
jgi:hypothetical protein